MQDFKTMRDMCAEQEEKFQFERFSRRDALNIGLKLIENAEKQAQPVAVEITVNGLVVFRYFMEGSRPESELWLARKRNAVGLVAPYVRGDGGRRSDVRRPQAVRRRLCGGRRLPDRAARHGRDRLDLRFRL